MDAICDVSMKMEKKEETDTMAEQTDVDWTALPPEPLDSFPSWKNAYQRYYCTDFTTPTQNLDTSILMHSNKICIVYLSPKHSLFNGNQQITRINFQVTPNLDRLQNKMSGKKKRGAQLLQPSSILCFLEADTRVCPVRSGIYGKLIEINPAIIEDPNLILRDPKKLGWIAIIMQDLSKANDNTAALVHEYNYSLVDLKDEQTVEVTIEDFDEDEEEEGDERTQHVTAVN